MIAFDTNCLLRLLTKDIPKQAQLVADRLEQSEKNGEPVFVSLPVLAETVGNLAWRRYRFNREQIISALGQILETPLFIVQERDVVVLALAGYREGWGDFNDHLIRCLAQHAGAEMVFTFDQELLDHRGFQSP